MLKPYDLLEGILAEIEKGLKDNINADTLAQKFLLSSTHLRRLFRFAFGQPVGTYIRSRKLAASIADLLQTNFSVLDIALEYGLEYEQSYIRAFRREFGLTPGELRKTGQIVKIKPPLHLFNYNKVADGLVFGPDIVMVPQFHVIGKKYKIPFRKALTLPSEVIYRFMTEDQLHIPNAIEPEVLVCISGQAGIDADYCFHMPAVQVGSLDNIPEGFDHETFPSSLCAKFRFVEPDDIQLNMGVADEMFSAIDDFMDDDRQEYFLERRRVNFDRIDPRAYGGIYQQWEWYAPVIKKTKNDMPKNQAGIIRTWKQEMPALRFIGRKYTEGEDDIYRKIHINLGNWCLNHTFDAIEKQSGRDLKTLYEGGDSYISLVRKNNDGLFEYWLGMFLPEGTDVPAGYEMIDFPESTLEVCRVYGKKNSIIHYDAQCRKRLAEENIHKEPDGTEWSFQRFSWRSFFGEDRFGKRIVDYCYYL